MDNHGGATPWLFFFLSKNSADYQNLLKMKDEMIKFAETHFILPQARKTFLARAQAIDNMLKMYQ